MQFAFKANAKPAEAVKSNIRLITLSRLILLVGLFSSSILLVNGRSAKAAQNGASNSQKVDDKARANGLSNQDRAPASEEDEAQFEKSFQAMLSNAGDEVQLKTNYLERLLRIHYRAELFITQFNNDLDAMLKEKKKNPNMNAEPLQKDSYKNLTKMWIISRETMHKLTYVYRRLYETVNDNGLSFEQRSKAAQILNDTHTWLDERPESDKLQLLEIYQQLSEVKKASDHARLNSKNSDRSTASADSSFKLKEFKSENFANAASNELEAMFKANALTIKKNATLQQNWRDKDESKDFGFMPVEPDRNPSSLKIYPSEGPDGNVIGSVFTDGTFSLTYDDGPGAKSTPRLINILKAHSDPVNGQGAPASFFCLANQTMANPGVIASLKSAGFPLNSHSWTHANLAKLSTAGRHKEVVESTTVLERAFGYKFKFFRCPYGACFAPKIPEVRKMIADQGMIHAYWRIDSADWQNIGQPQRTADLVIKQIQIVKKGVILMHDVHESSVDASKIILDWIRKQNSGSGFKVRLKTLEAAVDEANGVSR